MIYVLLCAYDEEKDIRSLLVDIAKVMDDAAGSYRVVLVDDGSRDETLAEARVAQELAPTLPLTILRHEQNRGFGAASETGIAHCLDLARKGDVLVTLDADNTHPPALIPKLVEALSDGFGIAIASRYRADSSVDGVPAGRRVLSELARVIYSTLFPMPGVREYTCSFRAYDLDLLRSARDRNGGVLTREVGFAATVDILLQLRSCDVRAVELPFHLEYAERAGSSKMDVPSTIRRCLAIVGRYLWRRERRRPTNGALP